MERIFIIYVRYNTAGYTPGVMVPAPDYSPVDGDFL